MSFEGYYRVLCKNGHLGVFDVYQEEPEDWECPFCREKYAWSEIVDETNGEGVETELTLEAGPELWTCPHCGQQKTLAVERWKIPTSNGGKMSFR